MSLPRLLFTAPEVAEALGVSAYWLCEQARSGQIPARKVAGAWRWTRAEVDALVEQDIAPVHRQIKPTPRRARRASQPSVETTSVVQLVARPPRRRHRD
ncbi:helix-turn-helix domain-containing protein [Streptomyces graminilatus]|uniref:helix-turn-helix domain-containing protein n=1 Tax=Streptomyces graminilatus TaxID=1464070 RepID=UPI0006E4304B|nr:helix-turn-helix domain-containing protein [Streptomyces graminilatus]